MTIAHTQTTPVAPRELRDACGEWITGVCVVTSTDATGAPVGMAVNSFSSLSLEPPLILFCPAKTSSTWPHIRDHGRFVVNILAEDQAELPRLFARRGGDKFAGVSHSFSEGLPVLEGVTAHLVCTLVDILEGGDHEIAVGRVEALERNQRAPLVFHQGKVIGKEN